MMKLSIIKKILICLLVEIIILPCFVGESYTQTAYNEIIADEVKYASAEEAESESEEKEINVYFYYLSGQGTAQSPFSPQKAEGDSYIITVGDVEILVDAGVDTGSASAIKEQMRKHVSSDKIWDYIIVTHADKDHIAAIGTMIEPLSVFSLFLGNSPEMQLGTLIDFDITQDETVEFEHKEDLFTTLIYKNYCRYRSAVIEKGTKYFTASQCNWKKRGLSEAPVQGATDRFNLDGEKTTLNILYNYYCDHKFDPDTQVSSTDRNNLCVCFSIDYQKNDEECDRLLFTADLEEFDSTKKPYSPVYGETQLVNNNPQLKEGVVFYKAGHHGSRTSSSKKFIEEIKPQYVVATGIAGNNSYSHEPNSDESFPATEVIDNIFRYTDRIYIPAVANYDDEGKKIGVSDYYGEITVGYSNNEGITVKTTANFDESKNEPIAIQNTEWFKKYRKATIYAYVLSGYENEDRCCMGNCTLIKYGHYDILLDCGVYAYNAHARINSDVYLKKIKKLCADNVLEYVVVSSTSSNSLQQMVDIERNKVIIKGILSQYKIENLIDFGNVVDVNNGSSNSLFNKYQKHKQECIENGTKYYSVSSVVDRDFDVTEGLTLDFLHNTNYGKTENSDVCLSVNFKNNKMLFLGNNKEDGIDSVLDYSKQGKNDLNNVVLFKVPDNGESNKKSYQLLSRLSEQNDNLTIVSNSVLNEPFFDRDRFTKNYCDKLIEESGIGNVFISSQMDQDGKYSEICGDIIYSIIYRQGADGEENEETCFGYDVLCSANKISLDETEYFSQIDS